jgi:putative endonuclease
MPETSAEKNWFVYMLRCADESLYTGVTTDITRRLREHNGELKGRGAKYTKARRPVTIVYFEVAVDRSSAQIREACLRKLSHAEKRRLAIDKKV